MSDRLILDYNNMLSPRLGGRGIDPARVDALAERFRQAHAEVTRRRDVGEIGFFQLPYQSEVREQVGNFANGLGQAFSTAVVLGIGGSALGAVALREALVKPHWNELDDDARDYFPRLYVLDNVDPSTLGPFLDRIDLGQTLFNVISKSGSTAETMSQFLVVRDRLGRAFEDDGYRRHLIFTTDPEKGVLRRIARDEQIATLPIPANVGGRFSVLSAVGLLPAALIGIDIDALLAGARDMDERCSSTELRENPAGLFAVLQYLADTEQRAPMHVMMSYSDRLYGVADWFRQLWAESLGKEKNRAGETVNVGPTPLKAMGATDQHSQVQLYMEGPYDKTITFLTVDQRGEDLEVPRAYEEMPELAYLGGHTMGELLSAERQATARALAHRGRMNMTLRLPRVDAGGIGQLLMMLQIATVYAGELYGVDPLDQPGVELGKQLTYGLMGRPGYQAEAGEPPDPRWMSE
jgi:glucose-6-phosphate isomerase